MSGSGLQSARAWRSASKNSRGTCLRTAEEEEGNRKVGGRASLFVPLLIERRFSLRRCGARENPVLLLQRRKGISNDARLAEAAYPAS